MAELVRQYLGNYRLRYLLGHGGFADVYLGEHIMLKTPAAIKVLRIQLPGEAQENFLRKSSVIAGLDHPNIVKVLEFGVDHHTPYIVMSYAPHGSLRQRYPQGTMLSAATILPYVRQVTAALQYAHERNLVHRDVKPENLLLGIDDHILLSDFGLAILAQSANRPYVQMKAGTAAYMAPEQLQGQACAASDQYALGIVMYEWLTGNRPFNGSDQEIAQQHAHCPPPPLAEKVPAIPPAIEQVVLKALAKNPSERFPTVQDCASAFEEACNAALDTQAIPATDQIFPATVDTFHLGQIDTPDSLTFIPDTYLAPESFSFFMPDLADASSYYHDDASIITDSSLVSVLPAASDDPVGREEIEMRSAGSVPGPYSSEECDQSSSYTACASPNLPLVRPVDDFEDVLQGRQVIEMRSASSVPGPYVMIGRDKSGPYVPHTPLPEVAKGKETSRHITRRSVLIGLAGIAAAGITGIGISAMVSTPKRPTSSHAPQPKIARTSNPTGDPGTTPSQKPSTPGHTSTTSPNSTPVSNPTNPASPTAPATPTGQPGSQNNSPLTIQVMNPPAQVHNNSQVNIAVSTSEPGVIVLLHISYNSASMKDVIMQQTSDSSGHANFFWQVQLPQALSGSTTATLTVSAVDQKGHRAVAAPLMVAISQ